MNTKLKAIAFALGLASLGAQAQIVETSSPGTPSPLLGNGVVVNIQPKVDLSSIPGGSGTGGGTGGVGGGGTGGVGGGGAGGVGGGGAGSPPPIPEPETYAMLMAGLSLMAAVVRRRRDKG